MMLAVNLFLKASMNTGVGPELGGLGSTAINEAIHAIGGAIGSWARNGVDTHPRHVAAPFIAAASFVPCTYTGRCIRPEDGKWSWASQCAAIRPSLAQTRGEVSRPVAGLRVDGLHGSVTRLMFQVPAG